MRENVLVPGQFGGDERLLLEESTNEFTDIENVATVKDTVLEMNLSGDERKAFDNSKDEAIIPWLGKDAWRAVKEKVAEPLEKCPLRFLLKWKTIEGGFRENDHARLQTRNCDFAETGHGCSNTQSSGRNILLRYISTMHWKVFVADVMSAFLQADIIVDEYQMRIFGVPNCDIRKRDWSA